MYLIKTGLRKGGVRPGPSVRSGDPPFPIWAGLGGNARGAPSGLPCCGRAVAVAQFMFKRPGADPPRVTTPGLDSAGIVSPDVLDLGFKAGVVSGATGDA